MNIKKKKTKAVIFSIPREIRLRLSNEKKDKSFAKAIAEYRMLKKDKYG